MAESPAPNLGDDVAQDWRMTQAMKYLYDHDRAAFMLFCQRSLQDPTLASTEQILSDISNHIDQLKSREQESGVTSPAQSHAAAADVPYSLKPFAPTGNEAVQLLSGNLDTGTTEMQGTAPTLELPHGPEESLKPYTPTGSEAVYLLSGNLETNTTAMQGTSPALELSHCRDESLKPHAATADVPYSLKPYAPTGCEAVQLLSGNSVTNTAATQGTTPSLELSHCRDKSLKPSTPTSCEAVKLLSRNLEANITAKQGTTPAPELSLCRDESLKPHAATADVPYSLKPYAPTGCEVVQLLAENSVTNTTAMQGKTPALELSHGHDESLKPYTPMGREAVQLLSGNLVTNTTTTQGTAPSLALSNRRDVSLKPCTPTGCEAVQLLSGNSVTKTTATQGTMPALELSHCLDDSLKPFSEPDLAYDTQVRRVVHTTARVVGETEQTAVHLEPEPQLFYIGDAYPEDTPDDGWLMDEKWTPSSTLEVLTQGSDWGTTPTDAFSDQETKKRPSRSALRRRRRKDRITAASAPPLYHDTVLKMFESTDAPT